MEVWPRRLIFRYRSAAHFIEVFRGWYGPVHKAFAALPVYRASALETDQTALLHRLNRAGPASLVVPSEYLEVVVRLRWRLAELEMYRPGCRASRRPLGPPVLHDRRRGLP